MNKFSMSSVKKSIFSVLILMSAELIFAENITNPAAPDPAIFRIGDVFYMYATGRGVPIYLSTDLINWSGGGAVFDKALPDWARKEVPEAGNVWAPDIIKVGDLYYLYYAISSLGSQRSCIGLAVNKTLDPTLPEYEWIDRGKVIESFPEKNNFNAIDPSAYFDENGRLFMIFGSYWTGIKGMLLDPVTGKPGKNKRIRHIASAAKGTAIEAPYVIRRNGWYYLFVSWGSTMKGAESTYRVAIGRSKNVLGPYVDMDGKPMAKGGGTLVLAGHDNWRGTGHNSIAQTAGGLDLILHHTYDTNQLKRSRILQVRPLYWSDEGWPFAGEPLLKPVENYEKPAPFKPESISGKWRVSFDYGKDQHIELSSAEEGEKTWKWKKMADNKIGILIPEKAGPEGARSAVCFVEPQEDSFIGRTNQGEILRGIKVTDK